MESTTARNNSSVFFLSMCRDNDARDRKINSNKLIQTDR